MKIKFLNNIITVEQSTTVLPYPFYDINYAYKSVRISPHILTDKSTDKEQLNTLILKGCIDICMRDMNGLGQNVNPVYDYILSKINILPELYDITEDGNKINPYAEKEVSE